MGRPFKYHTEEERIAARNINNNLRRHKDWEETQRKRQEYYERTKDHIKQHWKEWYSENKEKHCDKVKKWREDNIERYKLTRNKQVAERKRKDSLFKFSSNIRTFIHSSFIRNNKKFKKTLTCDSILGCSLNEFKTYILNKCPEGTTLKNFGRCGYHIDHIIPISTATCEEDVIKLCHYTNLQPLWYIDNIKKRNNIVNYE